MPHLVSDALIALQRGDQAAADDAAVAFAQVCAMPVGRRITVTHLVTALSDATTEAWQRGWQPADVHRYAGKVLATPEQALVVDVMSLEMQRYAAATVDPRWLGQLDEVGGGVWWATSQTLLEAHRGRGLDWLTLLTRTLAVLHLLVTLPRLECLTPLPGSVVPPRPAAAASSADDADRPAADERILSRVRQLLAKAESTTFEAEAETFTAGAQALMARHSIDAALLAASGEGSRGGDAPQGRRIGIDNPYDSPKAMLLDAVASANRCKLVWNRELGFGTVVGFESDLESVEVLFTSLLVQATRAVTSAGSRTDAYGRSRTRSFRQSFLMAYAARIGERLEQVADQEVDAATAEGRTGGRELVPLLAARAEDVQRVVEDWFPELRNRAVRVGRDAEGWHSGRAAADRAHLGTGEQIASA
ncbi:MAG: DUF2786 domain-containing protein [Intrasporangium sp.]|uniref:DUF2786 domain-containing protein n=1 Tax=Intrasporangium sp. TaxID=1925024 RepID=UPI0026471E49|nr:DUF2786 domain-containing protein [Intrasporangium sp.]MDN5798318.1 DUF2786 domain-containing protein [Intrasporangium sp.]